VTLLKSMSVKRSNIGRYIIMTKTFEQTDLFSLFGIVDEVEEKKRQEEEKKAELAKNQPSTPSSVKPAPKAAASKNTGSKNPALDSHIPINGETKVFFQGEYVPITNYFTLEEMTRSNEAYKALKPKKTKKEENEEEVEKEQEVNKKELEKQLINQETIRVRLEQDYPVLVKQFTNIVYIKEKNLVVPILEAKKKGLMDCTEQGPDGSCSLKIPFWVLNDFISVAKHFCDKHHTEVHADVYMNLQTKEFFLHFPEQRVHRCWAEKTEDAYTAALNVLEWNATKIGEIHSHHVMDPIPSPTDDRNERTSIFYTIVGNLDRFFPTLTVRTFDVKTEQHIKIDPFSLYESPFGFTSKGYDISVVEVVKDAE
jgi:hypothetical protein